MKIEPCLGCGRGVLIHKIANLAVKCDPSPLDGVGVAREIVAGRSLWTPVFGPGLIPKELKPGRPGDTKLLAEHRCTRVSGASAPATPSRPVVAPQASPTLSEAESVLGGPARPGDASTAPFSSSRRTNPCCDGCSEPMADGTYASIELGSLVVWAQHVTECGGRE